VSSIEVLETGRLDERDSAFPSAIQLPTGDILCAFSVGGGATVTGGTEFARSTDGGRSWALEGNLLAPTDTHPANCLRLSLAPDGETVYAYGARYSPAEAAHFGKKMNEGVVCCSTDGGRSWTSPRVVPMPETCPLEISHSALVLKSGGLLAPAASLPAQGRLGETVYVAISDDGSATWPNHAVVFRDPNKQLGFFEHKLAELPDGRLMAICWTVTLKDVADQPNSFTLSHDGGLTWEPYHSTGIMGQTMTPIPLGDDRLLVLYNRRYGEQGVVAALVTFDDTSWHIHHETLLYDACSQRQRPDELEDGVKEFDTFAFGFPTAIRLQDGAFLATHWCHEAEACGIRWTRLEVDW
jgi:BNR repeat-like domain